MLFFFAKLLPSSSEELDDTGLVVLPGVAIELQRSVNWDKGTCCSKEFSPVTPGSDQTCLKKLVL